MDNMEFEIKGHIADVVKGRLFPGIIKVKDGRIESIEELDITDATPCWDYIIPGFIDAHVHIESSMLTPAEFARMAVVHGTLATVSDPHEIANVMGIEGVKYMVKNGNDVPFHFHFGAPSCVPATAFETAGAHLGPEHIREMLESGDTKYLAEMMNYPGVLHKDPEVMEKIRIAHALGVPVDGHAPGLRGEDIKAYASAGISTDHECFELDEAREKAALGMHILIREGSAAKNFEALIPILAEYPEQVMFCSDDKHPDNLVEGHINQLAARAVAKGHKLMDILRACSLNPIRHYNLPIGLLQPGDPADFVVVKDPESFEVLKTYKDGQLIAENGSSIIPRIESMAINRFEAIRPSEQDLRIEAGTGDARVISVRDGELITDLKLGKPMNVEGYWESNLKDDILKVIVQNRYAPAPPAIGFIHGFGLKQGALASTVAHDSHNIIAVGVNDASIIKAIDALVQCKGGISVTDEEKTEVLPLPLAGLMSLEDGYEVAVKYEALDKMAKDLGSGLGAPFMTMAFCALLVIPALKLSDKGLFDAQNFRFTSIDANQD